jgi:HSP20 family molecular chaperone IbpA
MAVTYMVVPGITSEQIDVSVNTAASVINVVINVEESDANEFMNQVYSERVQRSFRMTSDYDVEQTTVDLTNGVLTLTTPRIEKSPQSVKLPINTQVEGKKK